MLNNRWLKISVGLIFLAMFAIPADTSRGQDIETLRKQMNQAQKDIDRINTLINDNRNQQKNSLSNLKLVNQKIANRRTIIENYDKQIELTVRQMGERGQEIAANTTLLDSLKSQYKDLVGAAYVSYRSNGALAFIFASSDFQEAVRRIYYVRRIGEGVNFRAVKIDSVSRALNNEITNLQGRREELAALMVDKSKELDKLSAEQKQVKSMTDNLKGQEKKLSEEAAKFRTRLDALQRRIEQIIAEDNSSYGRSGNVSYALSGLFEQNKGRLPSPVRGGVIVDRFGIQDHPDQKGIKINNKGINIACREGSAVMSVFEGDVRKVFAVPGMGSCVIVRHGGYLSVYSNLQQVNVAPGDKISTGGKIGVVAGNSAGQPTMHFELWNESKNLNPEEWLSI